MSLSQPQQPNDDESKRREEETAAAMRQRALMVLLEPPARQRLTNIRMVKPELAAAVPRWDQGRAGQCLPVRPVGGL